MIRVDALHVKAGQFELKDFSVEVGPGEYTVLMGRTGCGKSTLLEAICGLRRIAAGKITVGKVDVTRAAPEDRSIGYVPQDLALFPTMTVRDHLEFALRLRRQSSEKINERTKEISDQLSIHHLLNRYPAGLSGGEAQRVALGRALSFRPPVLLLDEPLSALDDQTRGELIGLLNQIKLTRSVTILHVTHNSDEAKALGDRIVHLNSLKPGSIESGE